MCVLGLLRVNFINHFEQSVTKMVISFTDKIVPNLTNTQLEVTSNIVYQKDKDKSIGTKAAHRGGGGMILTPMIDFANIFAQSF